MYLPDSNACKSFLVNDFTLSRASQRYKGAPQSGRLYVCREQRSAPPWQECTAPFIAKSLLRQGRRDYAPFTCKGAARSFSLTSHQGFLNCGGCCSQSGCCCPPGTSDWNTGWLGGIEHTLRRKEEVVPSAFPIPCSSRVWNNPYYSSVFPASTTSPVSSN